MLTDFEDGTTFTLPPPYTLQAQYLTPEEYPGEHFSRAVPIAFVATSGDTILIVFRDTKTIPEWISDATFTKVPYAPVSGGSRTQTGFTDIYETINGAIIDEVNSLATSSVHDALRGPLRPDRRPGGLQADDRRRRRLQPELTPPSGCLAVAKSVVPIRDSTDNDTDMLP